jgi:hypothetical protein
VVCLQYLDFGPFHASLQLKSVHFVPLFCGEPLRPHNHFVFFRSFPSRHLKGTVWTVVTFRGVRMYITLALAPLVTHR